MVDKDIGSADYLKFINKRNGKPTCPLCQTDHWSLINETDERSYGMLNNSRRNPDFGDMRTASVLLLVCSNCGFIAPVLREKVTRELWGDNE
ncbi:MAG: hypothetical protein IBJ07_18450 [Rhizobiaceae bacterium]|nr:hypothetical protein [Rhizobiaceae bacterium]